MSLNLSLSKAVLQTQRDIAYELDFSIHTTFFNVHTLSHVMPSWHQYINKTVITFVKYFHFELIEISKWLYFKLRGKKNGHQ